ncbi:hypothetical protein EVAR_48597_1 [Eumeta japonica]|uniref:Uncharacterized protein n=1 Tax=Eumeta variegata TaxID=151549 RepID=A0A4C1YUS6_EUMVA|nr:hypothetical protein EVAR_48597_1 [Eumeta japonica]
MLHIGLASLAMDVSSPIAALIQLGRLRFKLPSLRKNGQECDWHQSRRSRLESRDRLRSESTTQLGLELRTSSESEQVHEGIYANEVAAKSWLYIEARSFFLAVPRTACGSGEIARSNIKGKREQRYSVAKSVAFSPKVPCLVGSDANAQKQCEGSLSRRPVNCHSLVDNGRPPSQYALSQHGGRKFYGP